jgi:proteasome-associated ATPase
MPAYNAHDAWLKREKARKFRTDVKNERKEQTMNGGFFISLEAPTPKAPPVPVRWADVIGQAEAKAAVKEVIEGVTKHAELYKKYGRRPPKGVLLYGPPGNGKTLLGKAAAYEMAQLNGQEAQETGFIYVKASDIFDKWFGGTEQKITALFARAKAHKKQHGYPAVLFVDEAENILGHRGYGSREGIAGGFGSNISVPVFLAEMDGLEESSAIVLLATNRQNALDPAVIREGRIDRKVFVGRPTKDDSKAFFNHYLQNRPLHSELGEIIDRAVEALFGEKNALYRVQLEADKERVVTLGDLTSGAQIAYLVDAATSVAIDREIAGGESSGLTADDFARVIERTAREYRGLDHFDAVAALLEPVAKSVVSIEKVLADGSRPKRSLIEKVPNGVELRIVGKDAAVA